MAPTPTPKLDVKWWKANKAKTLGKIGLSEALRKYEVAMARGKEGAILSALVAVNKAVAVGLRTANGSIHKETIAILKEYPDVIFAEEKRVKAEFDEKAKAEKAKADKGKAEKDKAEAAEKAAAKEKAKDKDPGKDPAAAPVQKISGPVVIWRRNIGADVKALINKHKDELPKPLKFDVDTSSVAELTLDGSLLDALEEAGDRVTPAFMVEDAQAVAEDALKDVAALMQGLIVYRNKGALRDRLRSFDKDVQAVMAGAKKRLEAIPEKRWKAFAAKHKQYRNYKVKAGLKLTLGVLAISGSAVSLAGAAASGGLSLPLSIIGLSRALMSVTSQIAALSKSAEKVRKQLEKDCKTLEDWYASKGKRLLNETAGTLTKGILGIDPGLAPTLGTIEKSYDLWDNKVAGCIVEAKKGSRAVLELLKECDVYEKKVKTAGTKEAHQAIVKLEKIRGEIDKALDHITSFSADAAKFEKNGPALKKVITALRSENSRISNIFEKVFPVTVNLVLVGAGSGNGFAKADEALKYAQSALNLFNGLAKETAAQAGAL